MIIYTTYKTTNTWYWTIHNPQTLGNYQLIFDIDDKKIRLFLPGHSKIYGVAALNFWQQLVGLWADKDYHAFIERVLQVCEYVDERKIDGQGLCENCNQIGTIRPVEIYSAFSGHSRGYRNVCFDCFGPRIKWRKNNKSRIYWSPVRT